MVKRPDNYGNFRSYPLMAPGVENRCETGQALLYYVLPGIALAVCGELDLFEQNITAESSILRFPRFKRVDESSFLLFGLLMVDNVYWHFTAKFKGELQTTWGLYAGNTPLIDDPDFFGE